MNNRHVIGSAIALVLVTGCGDATGVMVDGLAGTWTTQSMFFTSEAEPLLSVNLVAFGASLTLVLGVDETYSSTFVFPGEPTEEEMGTYTVSGSTLTLSETGTGRPEAYTISWDGDTMTLTLDDVFDFTEGIEGAGTLVITLTR